MHIPRNAALPSPSFEQVRLSGLLEGSKAAIVAAYPGAEPRRNLRNAPRGFLFVYHDGLVFLATGEQTGFSANDLVDLLAGEAAKQVIPLGGLVHSVLTFAHEMRRAARELPQQLERALSHLDTFRIPFVDLIEARHQIVGSIFSGRIPYARLTGEQADGIVQQYWIAPVDAESVESFMILRLAAEKRAVAGLLLRAQVDVDAVQRAVIQEFQTRYGDAAGDHLAELGAEITARLEQQLQARGLTFEQLDRQALDQLGHFRAHAQFAQYFR
ncbi:MAG TPA: hypothetical protein VGR24_04740 [bacterium]|jgi:hypothetical protein|nr:hypothetical protein [bacterium]